MASRNGPFWHLRVKDTFVFGALPLSGPQLALSAMRAFGAKPEHEASEASFVLDGPLTARLDPIRMMLTSVFSAHGWREPDKGPDRLVRLRDASEVALASEFGPGLVLQADTGGDADAPKTVHLSLTSRRGVKRMPVGPLASRRFYRTSFPLLWTLSKGSWPVNPKTCWPKRFGYRLLWRYQSAMTTFGPGFKPGTCGTVQTPYRQVLKPRGLLLGYIWLMHPRPRRVPWSGFWLFCLKIGLRFGLVLRSLWLMAC